MLTVVQSYNHSIVISAWGNKADSHSAMKIHGFWFHKQTGSRSSPPETEETKLEENKAESYSGHTVPLAME